MPGIDLLDAFAELVVCVVFNLPHNTQSSGGEDGNSASKGDQNAEPLPSQSQHSQRGASHPLSSRCATSDDENALAAGTDEHPVLPSPITHSVASVVHHSSASRLSSSGLDAAGGSTPLSSNSVNLLSHNLHHSQLPGQGSSASLDCLPPANLASGGAGLGGASRWPAPSRPSSVSSLTGSNANSHGLGRWLNPFRPRPIDGPHSSSGQGHGLASAGPRPLTATTVETSSFSRIADEDVLDYHTAGSGTGSGVPSPPLVPYFSGSNQNNQNSDSAAPSYCLEPGEAWEAQSCHTPVTPLSVQTPGMFSVSMTSTPHRGNGSNNNSNNNPNNPSSPGSFQLQRHTRQQQQYAADHHHDPNSGSNHSSNAEHEATDAAQPQPFLAPSIASTRHLDQQRQRQEGREEQTQPYLQASTQSSGHGLPESSSSEFVMM